MSGTIDQIAKFLGIYQAREQRASDAKKRVVREYGPLAQSTAVPKAPAVSRHQHTAMLRDLSLNRGSTQVSSATYDIDDPGADITVLRRGLGRAVDRHIVA